MAKKLQSVTYLGSFTINEQCDCGAPPNGEHGVKCLLYEPPLTQREIRALRQLVR